MSRLQRRSYEELSPLYKVTSNHSVDVEEIFPHREANPSRPLILEPGFGMGYSLADMADRHKEVDFIGIEVHKPGIGKIMSEIHRRGLSNLRILEGDAVEIIMNRIPARLFSGFHLFFPDPWPKKRHHKRRMVREGFPELIRSILIDTGYAYIVTDWDDYARQIQAVFMASPLFQERDIATPEGTLGSIPRIRTAFERKGLQKGHTIHDLFFPVK